MGTALGRMKILFRPVKNFNVEERAFKAISKDKPTPAPTHLRMQSIMEEIRQGWVVILYFTLGFISLIGERYLL